MKRLLSSLFGKKKGPSLPEALKDECFGDPAARRVKSLLRRGSWREAADLLEAERDWSRRATMVHVASNRTGRPSWLDAWVHERPDTPDGWLVRAFHSVVWAWEARTSGRAADVTEDGWNLFFERVQLAFDDLGEVVARDPEDPTPWAILVLCARAAQRPRGEALEYFAEATMRDPWHSLAHRQMLVFLCEKWFGSHDDMHEFARTAAAGAPEGSPVHDLVVDAFLEQYQYIRAFDEDVDGGHEYIRSPTVVKRALAAERARFTNARPGPELVRSQNLFAGFFFFAAQDEKAKEYLRASGIYTDHPWHLWGNEDRVYRDVRKHYFG